MVIILCNSSGGGGGGDGGLQLSKLNLKCGRHFQKQVTLSAAFVLNSYNAGHSVITLNVLFLFQVSLALSMP
jgi:hypothetical protein